MSNIIEEVRKKYSSVYDYDTIANEEKDIKILAFLAIKGGVGKSTLAYTYGYWLAKNNKKVLFIDLDDQCNLTSNFGNVNKLCLEGTVANIFSGEAPVQIHHVDTQELSGKVDFIAGDMNLDIYENILFGDTEKYKKLYYWMLENFDLLDLRSYDYIVIDCHPNFGTINKNAVMIADAVISPITPSGYGYDARYKIQARIEQFRKETIEKVVVDNKISYKDAFDAKLYFVANMIKHNTNTSKAVFQSFFADSEEIEKFNKKLTEEGEDPQYYDGELIGIIDDKELFNQSTINRVPLAIMENEKSINRLQGNVRFFERLNNTFTYMYNKL